MSYRRCPCRADACVPRGAHHDGRPDSKEYPMSAEEREDRDLHRDPITDETGSHPVGTGVGAAGGAAAGAAVGAIGGPIGMVVGGAVGAVAGGLAGKAVAERVNP